MSDFYTCAGVGARNLDELRLAGFVLGSAETRTAPVRGFSQGLRRVARADLNALVNGIRAAEDRERDQAAHERYLAEERDRAARHRARNPVWSALADAGLVNEYGRPVVRA